MAEIIHSFEDLECWRVARDLRLFVSRMILPALPNEERYRLGDQVLRAARSVTANIAEGYGRHHYLDNAKFCRNACGSCYEVLDHLIAAADDGLITNELLLVGRQKCQMTLKVLNGYIAYLKRAASPAQTPPNSR